MKYFLAGPYAVALNAKSGSSSMCLAIIKRWHSAIYQSLVTGAYPVGKTMYNVPWHGICPSSKTPDTPVVVMVRDPVERFLSGVTYLNIDLAEAIDSLSNGTMVSTNRGSINVATNIHFWHQHRACRGETHLFRFPQHVAEAQVLLDLEEFPHTNAGSSAKPTLTPEQRDVVEQHYAIDMGLYAAIVQPNTIQQHPVPPVDGGNALEEDDE